MWDSVEISNCSYSCGNWFFRGSANDFSKKSWYLKASHKRIFWGREKPIQSTCLWKYWNQWLSQKCGELPCNTGFNVCTLPIRFWVKKKPFSCVSKYIHQISPNLVWKELQGILSRLHFRMYLECLARISCNCSPHKIMHCQNNPEVSELVSAQ